MADLFREVTPNVENNLELRLPQREGYNAIRDYFASGAESEQEVGIVLPVGTGKTGLIALAPFSVGARRTLIIAPGLRIANQLYSQFDPNNPTSFYRRFHVLDEMTGLEPAEISGSDKSSLTDLKEANIVVTNIQQLQGSANQWLAQLPETFFDLILNDEAHHNVAASWENVRKAFPKAKVINFSATPDRADGRRMAGKIIYHFPVFRAIESNYIKHLTAVVLNPRTLRYVRRAGGQEVVVDLEEVRRLGQVDADFRRSIVSSSESLATIVDASIHELEHRRATTNNQRHKIIASALNIEHCIQITEAFRARGLRCEYVHSKLDSKVNEKIIRLLNDDLLDAVVQVRMLGEGFDHPYFSVAAVLSIFSNLSPFVQFVGRIMRTVPDGGQRENNVGTVVFHAGGNVASVWSDFQDFSKSDQDFFDQLLPTTELFIDEGARDVTVTPEPREPYEPSIEITTQEDVGLENIPLFANDTEAQDALQLLLSRGVTPDDYRLAIESLTPRSVTKQKQRRASRLALDSRIRTAAARLLAEHGLSAGGHDLDTRRFGKTNYVLVKSALDRKCNDLVGKGAGGRADFSQHDIDEISKAMPAIVLAISEELFDEQNQVIS